MVEVERLEILIDVVDRFSTTLDELLLKLGQVEVAAESVDNITIDVDVRGERQLDSLIARMGALRLAHRRRMGTSVGGRGRGPVRLGAVGGGVAGGGRAAAGAADAIDDMAENAARAAGVLDNAESTGNILNLRMSDLHNLLAQLVPLLLVFIGALPALIGAIVALATAAIAAASALFALGALGALGFAISRGGVGDIMGGFEDIIDEVSEDFLDAFAPLADRLTPLFEDALDGLDKLFQNIADEGDVLVGLTDMARDFGRFMLDFVPEFLADLGRMADAFAPLFGDLMDIMPSVLEGLTSFMADSADEFVLFTDLLLGFLPVIGQLSIGFLQVVNAIGVLTAAFGRLLSILPVSSEQIGAFVATLLTAITVSIIFSRILGVSAVTSIIAAVQSLGLYIGALLTYIPTVTAATAATIGFIIAVGIATAGLATVLGLVATAGGGFMGFKSQVDEATQSLRDFHDVGSNMGGTGGAEFGVDETTARRRATPRSSVTINVEGNADEEMVRRQSRNAMYRMQRPRMSGT